MEPAREVEARGNAERCPCRLGLLTPDRLSLHPLLHPLRPQLTFRDDPNPAKNEQAARGADLAHAAARFLLTLEASALPPDVYWALAKPAARNRAVQAVLSTLVPRRWAYYPFYALQAYPLDMSQ